MNWYLNDYTTKVTVELRDLVKSGIDIWDFDYPSYYEGEQKAAFERKVLEHYWFRQIGQETPGRFIAMFRSRIRDIMPYYVQLYKSVALMDSIEDPFESYNLTETFEQETTGSGSSSNQTTANMSRSGSSESETESTDKSTEKFSDTPQGTIENLDTHLTNATVKDQTHTDSFGGSETGSEEHTGSAESSSEESGSVKHTLTRKGNIGVSTLGEEMNKLRSSFINVDLLVINELRDLFLMIY